MGCNSWVEYLPRMLEALTLIPLIRKFLLDALAFQVPSSLPRKLQANLQRGNACRVSSSITKLNQEKCWAEEQEGPTSLASAPHTFRDEQPMELKIRVYLWPHVSLSTEK